MSRALQGLAPHDLRRTCARLCHSAGGNSNKFSFSSVTRQCKRPNGTSDVGRTSEKRSMIDFKSHSQATHLEHPRTLFAIIRFISYLLSAGTKRRMLPTETCCVSQSVVHCVLEAFEMGFSKSSANLHKINGLLSSSGRYKRCGLRNNADCVCMASSINGYIVKRGCGAWSALPRWQISRKVQPVFLRVLPSCGSLSALACLLS